MTDPANGFHNNLVCLPIKDHPHWFACNDGHIYDFQGVRVKEFFKEVGEDRPRVSCKSHGYHTVAKLIASAFIGTEAFSRAVTHTNGVIFDNRPENLELNESAGVASNRSNVDRLPPLELKRLHNLLDQRFPHTRIAAAMSISTKAVRYHRYRCKCPYRRTNQFRLF